MLYFKHLNLVIIFFLSMVCSHGQTIECTLDIGGEASNVVVEIFQLNEAQKQTMEELRAKYALIYKEVDGEIEKLFANHPQGTPEELITLAGKYKALQAKIMDASRATDEELIATFNQKQYDFYLSLCKKAFREPIEVTPVVYDVDTIVDEEK